MRSKLKLGFSGQINSRLVTLGIKVDEMMTKNEHLFTPEIVASKNALGIKTKEFQKIVIEAESNDKVKIDIRNEYRPTYVSSIRVLAIMINMIYTGNDKVLDSTGYDVMKEFKKYVFELIEIMLLSNGEEECSIDVKMKGASGYIFMEMWHTTNKDLPESEWDMDIETSKSGTIEGYKPGEVVYVRVVAVGKYKKEVYSKVSFIAVK